MGVDKNKRAYFAPGYDGPGAALKTVRLLYDFTTDGGSHTVGNVINKGASLPPSALITSITWRVVVAVTSLGSATIQLGFGTEEVITAIAKATLSLNAVGVATLSATPQKLVDGGAAKLYANVADLTAGNIEFFVQYVESAFGF